MRPPSFSFKRPDGFTYDVTRQGDETVVALAGELDMSSAPEFAVCLDRLRASCVSTVVVDLSALEFCDSSGLAVFANFQERAGQQGSRLVLRRPSQQVERLLSLTCLDGLLEARQRSRERDGPAS